MGITFEFENNSVMIKLLYLLRMKYFLSGPLSIDCSNSQHNAELNKLSVGLIIMTIKRKEIYK